MNCVVINLDRRKDRWISLKDHLENFENLNIHRISATDAKKLDIPTSTACKQSHINALRMAYRENWDYVVVLEDDARLRDNFVEKMDLLLDTANWDVIFLGPGRAKNPRKLHEISKNLSLVTSPLITGAHAVLYKKSSIPKCIKILEEDTIFQHVDLIYSQNLRHILIPVPFLAEFTDGNVSDVRGSTKADKEHLVHTEKILLSL